MEKDTFERFSALDFSCRSGQSEHSGLFAEYKKLTSGKTTDLDVQLISSLRTQHPELIVT
jgi:hypothetical protein